MPDDKDTKKTQERKSRKRRGVDLLVREAMYIEAENAREAGERKEGKKERRGRRFVRWKRKEGGKGKKGKKGTEVCPLEKPSVRTISARERGGQTAIQAREEPVQLSMGSIQEQMAGGETVRRQF